jgi:hypothetical protein
VVRLVLDSLYVAYLYWQNRMLATLAVVGHGCCCGPATAFATASRMGGRTVCMDATDNLLRQGLAQEPAAGASRHRLGKRRLLRNRPPSASPAAIT